MKKNIVTGILTFFFAAVLIVSSWKVFSILSDNRKSEREFENLSEIVESVREESTAAETLKAVETEEETVMADEPETTGESGRLLQYEALYEKNNDFFGWVAIDGTAIDYPVMYTPDEPEKYLHRSFSGEYSSNGVPFLDASCDPEGNHYLLHGHHMKSGSMFASLIKYAKESYWKEHPVIRFDTIYETGEFEVVAAFYSRVYNNDEDGFAYYRYGDLSDPDRFSEYVENVRKAAVYDTGITAEYGDVLLTLSTCSYHTADGRFVVVAKKIGENQGK